MTPKQNKSELQDQNYHLQKMMENVQSIITKKYEPVSLAFQITTNVNQIMQDGSDAIRLKYAFLKDTFQTFQNSENLPKEMVEGKLLEHIVNLLDVLATMIVLVDRETKRYNEVRIRLLISLQLTMYTRKTIKVARSQIHKTIRSVMSYATAFGVTESEMKKYLSDAILMHRKCIVQEES